MNWSSGPKNVVLESIRNVCKSSSLSRRKAASEMWSLNLQQSQCWGSELTSNRVLVLESEREAAGLHCETIRILMNVLLLFLLCGPLISPLHSLLHAAVCLSMALITLLINVILPTFCFSVPLEPTNKAVP